VNADAFFDALELVTSLGEIDAHVSESEVHLYGYIASLANAYANGIASSWGYTFAATIGGTPYSADLAMALRSLAIKGALVAAANDAYHVGPAAQAVRDVAARLESRAWRGECLRAAVMAGLTLTKATLKAATATALPPLEAGVGARPMLDGPEQNDVAHEFETLRGLLAGGGGVLGAIAIWLAARARAHLAAMQPVATA
jgi:hypothetical protein